MRCVIVLPTYNERDSLEISVLEIQRHLPDASVLIVDDASPDGTGEIADELASKNNKISVLHRTSKDGLGPAYVAGFNWALQRNFDLILEMDADGSHRAQDLPRLLEAAADADLVIGSRWINGGAVENWPLSRQLISRFGNFYAAALLGSKLRDLTAGFRVYRRELLTQLISLPVSSHGYSFQVELAWRAETLGARIAEVPIVFVERALGNSKMNSKIVFEALLLITQWGMKRLFRGRRR